MKGGGRMMEIWWVKEMKHKNRQEILLPLGRRSFCYINMRHAPLLELSLMSVYDELLLGLGNIDLMILTNPNRLREAHSEIRL